MPSYGSELYVNISPGVLDIVCSFIHPKFKEFLFRDWSSLSKEDVTYFMLNYKDVAVFRDYWSKLDVFARQDIWNEFIILAVQEDFFPLLEFLMSSCYEIFKRAIFSYNFQKAKNLAIKLERKKMSKYLENYHKLEKNNEIQVQFKMKYQQERIKRRFFRNR